MTSRGRTLLFAAAIGGVVLIGLDAVSELVLLSWRDRTASHLSAVPLVSAALVYRGRARIFRAIRWDARAGIGIVTVGAVIVRAGAESRSPSLVGTGGVLLLIGIFFAIFGRDAVRAAAFPLAFLAFMIPIPQPVLSGGTRLLRDGSAEAVGWLLTLMGTPYLREGSTFALPHVTIEIADDCSGIRSCIGLLLTALVAGQLLLRTAWHKVAVISLVIPVSILKNAVRIVALSLLAIHVDPGFLRGQLHHDGGVLFFALTWLLLGPFLLWLRRAEGPAAQRAGGRPALL